MAKTKAREKKEPGIMTLDEIREKAGSLGIKADNLTLAQMVRDIQLAEGHKACFGRFGGECSESSCAFRGHCLEAESTGNDQAQETVEQVQDREQIEKQLAGQKAQQASTIQRIQQKTNECKQGEAAAQESRDRFEQRFAGDDANVEINADITQEMADIFSIVKSLEMQVETSSKLNEKLSTDVSETQHKLVEESSTRNDLEERLKTVESQAAQADQLSKDIAYTENERQKLSRLLAESHQQLQALTGDYELLSDRINAAEAHAKNATSLQKQVNYLKEKLEISDCQMSDMKKQLEKQKAEVLSVNGALQQEIAKRKKKEQVMDEVKMRLKRLSI